jgi:predicted alpha/beta hydrolase family esterase
MKIYNIPGWKNSDENHWQSIWEYNEPDIFQRIDQEDWLYPKKEKWSAEIGRRLKDQNDYLVTCHSIGCMAFIDAAFAFKLKPKGLLFVAPSDPEQPNYPK